MAGALGDVIELCGGDLGHGGRPYIDGQAVEGVHDGHEVLGELDRDVEIVAREGRGRDVQRRVLSIVGVGMRQGRDGQWLVLARERALPVRLDVPSDLELDAAVGPYAFEDDVHVSHEVHVPVKEREGHVGAVLQALEHLRQEYSLGDACRAEGGVHLALEVKVLHVGDLERHFLALLGDREYHGVWDASLLAGTRVARREHELERRGEAGEYVWPVAERLAVQLDRLVGEAQAQQRSLVEVVVSVRAEGNDGRRQVQGRDAIAFEVHVGRLGHRRRRRGL